MINKTASPRALAALGAGLFMLAMSAFAQVGIGIAPPRFELLMRPGDTATYSLAVFSKNTPDQQIEVSLADWVSDETGAVKIYQPGVLAHSAAHWINVALDPFNLKANSSHEIKFSVTIPDDNALQGSYWSALSFKTKPIPVKKQGITTLVSTRALAVVYVTIQGTEKPAAALQGVSLVTAKEGGRKLVADVVNKGNVYLRLNGELRFVNAKGEVVKRAPLPERVLLRDGLVRYELPVPADLPEDVVLAAIEIQPQGPARSYGGPPLYGEVDLK